MKVKVSYDPNTTKVLGYYPENFKYKSIPKPFIEIEEEAQDKTGKEMAVVGGIYQEYQKTDDEKKTELKNKLIIVRKSYLYDSAAYYMPDFPQDVLEKRALARSDINKIEAAATLTDLSQFSETF